MEDSIVTKIANEVVQIINFVFRTLFLFVYLVALRFSFVSSWVEPVLS